MTKLKQVIKKIITTYEKYINSPKRFGIDNSFPDEIIITYLSPLSDRKRHGISGGVKIIYQQSEEINNLLSPKFQSQVLHPDNINFICNWFEHSAKIKRNLNFNIKKEFLIIPEVWAEKYAPQCKLLGLKYGIFVQNGYLIASTNNNTSTFFAYHNAEIILTISDDTTDCCKLAFPAIASKIMRVHYFVDPNKFKPNQKKNNVITYMPRKIPKHSKLVIFFLEKHLPENWKIIPIINMTENEVIKTIQMSKIFLSFSEFEGCQLPPIEAALTGNKVIGYTGEGGKEYWKPPIFSEIMMGDIKCFVNEIISEIHKYDTNNGFIFDKNEIQKLADLYSKERERNDILRLSEKIKKVLLS